MAILGAYMRMSSQSFVFSQIQQFSRRPRGFLPRPGAGARRYRMFDLCWVAGNANGRENRAAAGLTTRDDERRDF